MNNAGSFQGSRTFEWVRAVSCLAIVGLLFGATPAWSAQALWVADSIGDGVQEFSPSDLTMNGSPIPNMLDIIDFLVFGEAFDAAGNLWAVAFTGSDSEVLEFSSTQLKDLTSNDTPTPVVVITSSAFSSDLRGCAMDAKGNLWIANLGLGVQEISSTQLAAGTADVTPAITVTVADFTHVNFIGFDKSGNLWASDTDAAKVYELKKKQLKSSKTVKPAVVISSSAFAENGQPVFDSAGNLWVTSGDGGTVLKFTKKSIKKSGTRKPAVIISDDGSLSLNYPFGLAFDTSGDLWVSNYHDASISEYTPSQLKMSGGPTPEVHLTNTSDLLSPYELTFGPSD